MGYLGLQGISEGYRALQGVTGGCKGLGRVTVLDGNKMKTLLKK